MAHRLGSTYSEFQYVIKSTNASRKRLSATTMPFKNRQAALSVRNKSQDAINTGELHTGLNRQY